MRMVNADSAPSTAAIDHAVVVLGGGEPTTGPPEEAAASPGWPGLLIELPGAPDHREVSALLNAWLTVIDRGNPSEVTIDVPNPGANPSETFTMLRFLVDCLGRRGIPYQIRHVSAQQEAPKTAAKIEDTGPLIDGEPNITMATEPR
jgi:hypothetical protein